MRAVPGQTLTPVKAATDRFTMVSKSGAGWWTLALGLSALVLGPLLGFGLVGLLSATAAFAAGVTAYRQGERSWMLWLGVALAIGVVCYLPFMSSDYPYTN